MLSGRAALTFGNTELLDKAANGPRDIKWHFIGQLQSNKCKTLAERMPNLWAVESLDSAKKADALEKGRASLAQSSGNPSELRVFVQVNTSGMLHETFGA